MKKVLCVWLTLVCLLGVALADGGVCPSCGAAVTTKFCGNCGTQVSDASEWTCPDCGTVNTQNFCGQCGASRPSSGSGSTHGQTAVAGITINQRVFELSDDFSTDRGRVTVTWTDSEDQSPYTVAFECVGNAGVSHPGYYAGGDLAGSTTNAKSFTLEDLIPGRTYIIEVTDCNDNSVTKTYTMPEASPFVDGKLTGSSVKVKAQPRTKATYADYSTAASIDQLEASKIIRDLGTKDYGVRLTIDYPQLARSREYFTQIAIIAPNGYTECEERLTDSYGAKYDYKYWYIIGSWTFNKIYECNSTIPTGTWTVELYWDGMFVNSATFTVR